MKINDRIYWISGGPWGYLGNAYAIKHSNGYVLVDTGSPEALDVIVKNLKYWNIDENKITHVLITHAHDDHTGCAHYFQKCGAKIVMGKEDAKMLEDGHLGEYSPCTNHVMPACKADILIDKDEILQIGDLEFEILCLPGHTDGTLLYFVRIDDENVMFSGDMFYTDGKWGEETRTGWKGDLSYSSKKLGESFEKLYKLKEEPDLALAGHGIPRFGKEAEVIRLAYKYYLKFDR